MRLFNPDTIARPGSNYSHGALVSAEADRLLIAGQVGIAPDGRLEKGFEVQSRRAWSNLFYVTLPGVTAAYRAIRDEVMEGHAPPMTYLEIAGLSAPDMLVEIEGEAVQGEQTRQRKGSER